MAGCKTQDVIIIDYQAWNITNNNNWLTIYWGLPSCCDVNTEEQWASCNAGYSQMIIYNSDPVKVQTQIYSLQQNFIF